MDIQAGNPYQKLSKTPLSQQYQICGCNPKTVGGILAFISVLIDPVAVLITAAAFLTGKKSSPSFGHRDSTFQDSFFEEHREKWRKEHGSVEDVPRYIAVGLGVVFSVIHLIAITVLLVGVVRGQTRLFYCWFCTMMCQIFMGKIGFCMFLFVLGEKLAPLLLGTILLDIPLIIAMVYCVGQISVMERNLRYSQGVIKYNVAAPSQTGPAQPMLPPGSYPRQL